METIIKFIITIALAGVVIALLPATPFTAILSAIGQLPYIENVAWFLPVHAIVSVTTVWVTTIISYFIVSWVLRQLDIIGQ